VRSIRTEEIEMTKVRIAIAALTLGCIGVLGVAPAHAGKSCPKGSVYVGGRSGGSCVDLDSGDIVKSIRNNLG
jgi:hypothetical protein